MKQSQKWHIALILAILAIAVYYLLPTFIQGEGHKFLPDSKINFGLDLQGGIYLTLEVDAEKAFENEMTQYGQAVRSELRSQGISITTPRRVEGGKGISFDLPAGTDKALTDKTLAEKFPVLKVESSAIDGGFTRYILGARPEEFARLENDTIDQALKTISNRIDEFGVLEPDIRRQAGSNRIILQLPGIKDANRAIDIVRQTAHLEFHIVNTNVTAEDIAAGRIPANTMVLPMVSRNGQPEQPIAVFRDALMTGSHIKHAQQESDEFGGPSVGMVFTPQGSNLFARVTEDNKGKLMAIVLDGKVYSAPVIKQAITQGRAAITGSFTLNEARDLALVLRAGALPAPVKVLEERTVGPTLGQESIEKGVKAAVLGGICVVVFMIIYYSMSGVIASVMLALDMLLLLAGMGMLGATLTLPGIAGIVLTLGMAVDANVLIYERIREELGKGLTPRAAIEVGFSKATMTILDSNLTTVIAAIVLYQFGTGPIRGFAVTLTLGIIVSMFTAIIVSRTVFRVWKNNESASLSI